MHGIKLNGVSLPSFLLCCREIDKFLFWFVLVGEEQEMHAKLAVEKQAITKVTAEVAEVLNGDPASFWDAFYSQVKGLLFLFYQIIFLNQYTPA